MFRNPEALTRRAGRRGRCGMTAFGLAVFALIATGYTAAAQSPTPLAFGPSGSPPAGRPRIEINPRPPLFRRCVSWYELQYRPSGTVLFPAKHCWWVRG
jgi:hypothetical protein